MTTDRTAAKTWFTVEPGERGEVFLECPVKGCPWNAEAARHSLAELLTAASAHLAAVHPEVAEEVKP